ncbi:heavy metal efflux pump, CzcA family [Maricaulis maris MCS10]|uniref:Heavy metal efflux pump, CzcA family n=1 Tax=Maricaulis maris (strain MCS10) TaxID=394221 RepID=Q0AM64_MARMM|nr:CusA/CzcA family heavy metal efflux RND transporter [Maricaulis maris]ABI66629.1 heavy metal efflux pump, CzcA family [Maricaulis maris MCS10]
MDTRTNPSQQAGGLTGLLHRIAGGRLLAALAFAFVLIGGIVTFRTMPVDAFPDVTPTLVQVFTETEGLAPEEVERYVTFPVETSMNGLPRLREVRSTSNFGLSVVNIYFEDGVDIYWARQLVGERLQQAREEIPEGFGDPGMGPITTGLGQILFYFLQTSDENLDGVQLRTLQDWQVKFDLQTVRGVTEVLSLGGFEQQYQINVRPDALLRYQLAIEDIVTAVESNNANAGAQFLIENSEQYTVRAVGLAQGIHDLSDIIVKVEDGVPVRVRDVANIDIGGAPRQGMATMDGQGEVVAGLVLKLLGANTNEVIARVHDRMERINEALPPGVTAVPYYDQSELVGAAVRTMTTALWQGALLVAIILFLFLRGWRPSLIVVASIPFSVGFALLAMQFFGVSANLMSLGGIAIAIGMMVDGAVVIVENANRILTAAKEGEDKRALIASACAEVLQPLIFAILIVVVVFVPILTLEGVEGKMFRPLAFSVVFAMAGSLVFAVLLAPAASMLGLKVGERSSGSDKPDFYERSFAPLVRFFVHKRWAALVLAAAMLIVGGAIFPRLGSEFTPRMNEGDLLVRLTMAPSISLPEARETVTRFEQQLLANFPEVERIVTRIGRGEVGAHADPVNSAEAFVALTPRDQWETAETQAALLAMMSESFESFPGARFNFTQPIASATDELLTGTKADLAIKLFGEDMTVLEDYAAQIAGVIRDVSGSADVQTDQVTGAPQLRITVNREAISRFGLNVEDVLSVVRTAIGGSQAGQVFEGVRRFDIIVRYREQDRLNAERISRIVLNGPGDEIIPLSQVATVERIEGPRQITRENGQRYITIQTNVRERDIGSFVAEGQGAVAENIELPPGYFVEWGGQFELQQQANARFAIVIPVTLGVVFLLLLFSFGRLKSAVLIIANIPLALVGGIAALWLTGQNLSVPASVGFIALFGIALGNGMVLVSFLDRFAKERLDVDAFSVEAAVRRAQPVLMTATTTGLGLMPLLFASGIGSEVQRPLAAVVIGGLVTSTVLTLLVLPAVYKWFAPHPQSRAPERLPT